MAHGFGIAMKHMKGYRCATKGTMGLHEALLEAFYERLSKTGSLDKTLSYMNRYYFNGQYVDGISGQEIYEWFQDVIEQMNAQKHQDGKRRYQKNTSIALGFVGYPDAEFTQTLTESEKSDLSKDVRDAFSLWLGHTVEAQADHEDEGFGKDKNTGEIVQFGGWHSHLFGLPLDANGNLEPRKLTNKQRMRDLHRVVIDYLNQKIPGLDGQYASRNWDFEAHQLGGNPEKKSGLSANERAEIIEHKKAAKALEEEAQRLLDNTQAKVDEIRRNLEDEITKKRQELEQDAKDIDSKLQARSLALDERSAALDGREGALDKRESTLDERESTLNERASALDERQSTLDALSDSLDEREQKLQDTARSLNDRMNAKQQELRDDIAALDSRSASLDERESALAARSSSLDTRSDSLKKRAQDLQTKIDALTERSAALDERQTDIDALDIRLTNSLKKTERKQKEIDSFHDEVKSQIGVDVSSQNWQQTLANVIQTIRRKALEESEEVVGKMLSALREFHKFVSFNYAFKESYTQEDLDILNESKSVSQQLKEIEISYGIASPEIPKETQQTQQNNAQTIQKYLDAIEENRNENQGEFDSPLL